MATHPPVSGKKPAPAGGKAPLVPPEEQFWERYSPHHEAPLSGVGSLTLHVLGIGFLFLAALIIAILAGDNVQSLPMEPISITDPGGGGKREGTGKEQGTSPKEDTTGNAVAPPPTPDVARTDLPKEVQPEKSGLDLPKEDETTRPVASPAARLNALSEKARSSLVLNEPAQAAPAGTGGTGSGGGQGTGVGVGKGAGTGEGTARMNQRTARMMRWKMSFETRNGNDYLRQLNGLKAFIAIPLAGKDGEYELIRDLSHRPAEPKEEDVRKLQRIFWIDDNPHSVGGMMQALGVDRRPPYFVAFFPEDLEKKLFELERSFRGLKEEEIFETRFRVKQTGRGFEPEVTDQVKK